MSAQRTEADLILGQDVGLFMTHLRHRTPRLGRPSPASIAGVAGARADHPASGLAVTGNEPTVSLDTAGSGREIMKSVTGPYLDGEEAASPSGTMYTDVAG